MDWSSAAQWLDELEGKSMAEFGKGVARPALRVRNDVAREQVRMNLPAATVHALRDECISRSVPFMTLTAKLVEIVVSENMIDAVLDGEFPRKEGV